MAKTNKKKLQNLHPLPTVLMSSSSSSKLMKVVIHSTEWNNFVKFNKEREAQSWSEPQRTGMLLQKRSNSI